MFPFRETRSGGSAAVLRARKRAAVAGREKPPPALRRLSPDDLNKSLFPSTMRSWFVFISPSAWDGFRSLAGRVFSLGEDQVGIPELRALQGDSGTAHLGRACSGAERIGRQPKASGSQDGRDAERPAFGPDEPRFRSRAPLSLGRRLVRPRRRSSWTQKRRKVHDDEDIAKAIGFVRAARLASAYPRRSWHARRRGKRPPRLPIKTRVEPLQDAQSQTPRSLSNGDSPFAVGSSSAA